MAWVEGGGEPIVRVPRSDLAAAAAWASSQGAEGVLVRQVGQPRTYWLGPGGIPFNKADLLPADELTAASVAPAGWFDAVRSVEPDVPGHMAYWSDRAWWSLNPGSASRRRRPFDGELDELLERAERVGLRRWSANGSGGSTEVVVSCFDLFLEGGLHPRGMIRQRQVEGLDLVVSDAEDAVNPKFHAGPPVETTLDPPG